MTYVLEYIKKEEFDDYLSHLKNGKKVRIIDCNTAKEFKLFIIKNGIIPFVDSGFLGDEVYYEFAIK